MAARNNTTVFLNWVGLRRTKEAADSARKSLHRYVRCSWPCHDEPKPFYKPEKIVMKDSAKR